MYGGNLEDKADLGGPVRTLKPLYAAYAPKSPSPKAPPSAEPLGKAFRVHMPIEARPQRLDRTAKT
jgi:hypothetical protein